MVSGMWPDSFGVPVIWRDLQRTAVLGRRGVTRGRGGGGAPGRCVCMYMYMNFDEAAHVARHVHKGPKVTNGAGQGSVQVLIPGDVELPGGGTGQQEETRHA
jgi:hypothetical protein